jgi:asparagine synthase (glutamine-hydrolysing)
MCGITGIISKNPTIINNFNRDIKVMTDTLIHRGPDGEGFFFNENVAFGHTRLSIIDLSENAKQPMFYLNKYVITYNGEIFNYLEIRKMLAAVGYQFKSSSDTEVILAAFDHWGTGCLKKFNGMWAFVIYDLINRKVFISRDRFGIKPLYYYKDKENFIFASEIKAIIKHPVVDYEPDISYCKSYIENGPKEYIKETAFKNIWRFLHSSYIYMDIEDLLTTDLNEKQFWQLKANTTDEKFSKSRLKELSKEYYSLLEDAVSLRLRSDVKVGSALSGGLDSSSIVNIINLLLRKNKKNLENQETFSCVYKTKGTENCDESKYINKIANFLQVNSNQIEPDIDEIIAEYKKIIYHFDTPPESTCLSGWYTFKSVAKTDTKVTLDGQGADEQLAGYLEYIQYYLAASRNPLFEYIRFLFMPGTGVIALKGLILGILRLIFSENIANKIVKNILRKKYVYENLNQVLLNQTLTSLITLIHYSDRASMAHSVESRMPFMDYRLMELLASVPPNYKIHNGWTKYLARFAMDKKLPDEITWRKDKMGWPIPEDFWFRGKLKQWFREVIESSEFLKEIKVHHNITMNINNKKYPIKKMIRFLNLAMWYETFFS